MKTYEWLQATLFLIFLSLTHTLLAQKKPIASTIDGNWSGSAYQANVNESWAITFVCNTKIKSFTILYPSQGCSGHLEFLRKSKSAIEFREHISQGTRLCLDSCIIRLKMIDDNTLKYQAIIQRPAFNILAEGTLKKQ